MCLSSAPTIVRPFVNLDHLHSRPLSFPVDQSPGSLNLYCFCVCPDKWPPTGCLKQWKCVLLMIWKPEVWNQRVAGLCSFWRFQGRAVPGLFQILVAPGFLGLWPHHSILCPHLHMGCFPVSLLCVSLIRTLVFEFRTHLVNLVSHLEILYYP